MSVGVSIGCSANDGPLIRHRMTNGVARMVEKYRHLTLRVRDRSGLPEGNGSAENEQDEECDFHSVFD